MRTIPAVIMLAALILASTGTQVGAQDRAAYDQRSIARYMEMFTFYDVDRKGEVSRQQVASNVEFTAVFDDIDINRDGIVTKAELDRFLAQRFGTASK
jgi:hypothetical protein